VRQYCKTVRMPAVEANFISMAEQAAKENHSHIRYLEALLAMECEERDRHAISNRIRDAQLPRMKALEEFDFTQAPQIPAARIRELSLSVLIGYNSAYPWTAHIFVRQSPPRNQNPYLRLTLRYGRCRSASMEGARSPGGRRLARSVIGFCFLITIVDA
jgi:hypothetical protein